MKEESHEAFARGGLVDHKPLDYPRNSPKKHAQDEQMHRDHKVHGRHSEMHKQIREGKAGFRKGGHTGFNKGGIVGVGGGADTKGRVGRDTGRGSKSE
jgi:hypothetical protein